MTEEHYYTTYAPNHPKVRLGSRHDGGYVMIDIPSASYDAFLSGGIGNNITFEKAFLDKYPDLKGIAFDGTLKQDPPGIHPHLEIVKKNIGPVTNEKTVNIKDYFKGYKNIFMKMDIEGGENALFASLTDEDLTKIKQLVIEFHSVTQVGIMKRLQKTHWLVHIHPNNNGKLKQEGDLQIPMLVECTYIRREPGESLGLNRRPIPDPLIDMRNVSHLPEVSLTGPPYQHL